MDNRAVLSNKGNIQSRMHYTAYGEDINSGTGLRTATQGFGVSSTFLQKYGLTERDDATGMDHTHWRKHENRAGRWTSPDPYKGSCVVNKPQSWNRYGYVQNEPTNFIDPSGLDGCTFYIDHNGTPAFDCRVQSQPYSQGVVGSSGGVGGSMYRRSFYAKCPGGSCGGGGGNQSNPGTTSANDDKKKEKAYNDCMKAETRKCEAQGRAYFNDNFYSAVLTGTAAGVGVRTFHAVGESKGWWAAFKGSVGQVIRKAGPYVAVVTSTWAVRSLAKAGQAIEDTCMADKDELCRRRSGLL